MAIEFQLPEISEGVETTDISEILIAEGDVIQADQIVMELETDKAVVELPCPHAGRVAKILVAQGDSVAIGTVLFTLEASTPAETAEPSQPVAPAPTPVVVAETIAERPEVSSTTVSASKAAAQPSTDVSDDGQERPPAPAGPTTRRLARKLAVDLYQVTGTGPGGRISAEDVQAYVRDRLSRQPSSAAGAPFVAPPLPDFSQFGSVERQPLTKIARASAANLSMCWQVIPHVTQNDLADITEIEAARKRYGQSRVGQTGPKVTMTAIVMKAVVSALKAFPHFNASLDSQSNELVLKQYYHIGCAVDTPHGLLVPVVYDVDQKTILEVAVSLTDLANRARERKLKLDEMKGATITITNLGGIGGTGFTPIVNYPEVAILGLSRGRHELQMHEGQPRERLMLPLSLSYDHRVINGANAARFVRKLADGLSDSFQLLIDC